MMDLKSVGMLFHSQYDGKVIKAMFQTTNQIYIVTASDKGWPMIVGGYTIQKKTAFRRVVPKSQPIWRYKLISPTKQGNLTPQAELLETKQKGTLLLLPSNLALQP